ncbi:MAG TPA: zinc-binding protein [Pyrodictium sp.]|nr:zinc-binding protein [Pyrodictium sp.]
MGRRRKRYKKIQLLRPPRRLPTIFECPNCGARMLSVELDKKQKNDKGEILAKVKCGHCGLYTEMWVPQIFQAVDVYSKFLDAYLEGTIEYKILKEGASTSSQVLEELMAASKTTIEGEEEGEGTEGGKTS